MLKRLYRMLHRSNVLPCRRAAVPLLLMLLANLLIACLNDDEDADQRQSLVNTGDQVPAFTLMDDDGKELTSEMLKGKMYVLNFFDTSCPDCQQELDVLQRVYDTYDAAVTIINVPRSQTSLQVKSYWLQKQLSMPYYMPADKNLYYQFAKAGIPRTYVVDAGGCVSAAFCDSPVADYDTLTSLFFPPSSRTPTLTEFCKTIN